MVSIKWGTRRRVMMAQQNFGMPPQAPMPPQCPVPPQAVPPYAVPPHKPARPRSQVPGILLIVMGALGVLATMALFVLPLVLFLLGGDGDFDAFGDFYSGFAHTAVIVGTASVVLLIVGVIHAILVGIERSRTEYLPQGGPADRWR